MGREGSGRKAKNCGAHLQTNARPGFFHNAGAFHAKARPREAIHQHVFRQ